ncbi:unnamed protein product [Lupinus luteus]|uniref:Uncharacterized protein n=1 Tax=Lupinus luteus TaxID=3873 RepID=A0AAV1XRQ4_LUPLU
MMRTIPNNEDNNNNNEEVGNDYEGSLKKGPWTPDEDAILIDYVNTYGEGNWNSVPKNSGLSRCGKSCRLRWANHLRPNLKKGAFSPEEERIIVDLHAKLGNKWARMASQLPGRTDNEIKNFWNTRIKRRERAGLPIYPPEVIRDATLYHLREEQYFEKPYNSSLSSSSFPPLLSSYPKKLNASNHYHALVSPKKLNASNHYHALVNPKKNQPISLYGSSSNLFNYHGFVVSNNSAQPVSNDYQYYNNGFNASSIMPPLAPSSVSSSQTPPDSVTPASSNVSAVDGFIGASSKVNSEQYEVAPFSPQGNSGLLGALVVEGQSILRNNKIKSEDSTVAAAAEKSSNKRKSIVIMENAERGTTVESALLKKKNSGKSSNETPMSSSGKKQIGKEASLEEMDVSWDDDLCSLLNNFPTEMPTPEWYSTGGDNKAEPLGRESQPSAPPPAPTVDQELGWNVGTSWNNMPSIC